MKFSKLSLIRVLTTYHGWQHLYSNRILCITDFFMKMCRFDLLWCTPVHKHAMMKCFLRMLKVINNKMTLMAYSLCIHQSLHFWFCGKKLFWFVPKNKRKYFSEFLRVSDIFWFVVLWKTNYKYFLLWCAS